MRTATGARAATGRAQDVEHQRSERERDGDQLVPGHGHARAHEARERCRIRLRAERDQQEPPERREGVEDRLDRATEDDVAHDEVLAMVDQEAHHAVGTVERGDRQAGLAQDGAGDREGIDRIALAGLPPGAAGAGHELGRDPHDRLTGPHELGIEPARQVAAVLEAPGPLGPLGRPATELEVARVRRGDRLLGQLATRCIDHDDGVTPLVQIRAQDDYVSVSSSSEVTTGRSADTPESGRSHAPIKSRRPVHHVSRPAKHMEATPIGWAASVRARP